jgi:crotonobetainyl-CoA:carnitine CoA-transferase CaiB-like acyl-CoA transferase
MRPLEGVRVLDFGQGAAGPYGAMLLGDFGATVIKVEPPRGDWCRKVGTMVDAHCGTTFLTVNRNKRGICLDMSKERGRQIARELALASDVIVESFRPGVMAKFGLDYATLSAERPALVYCSVSGFGSSGPNVEMPAGDSIMQAYGGLMTIIGTQEGGPMRVGNIVVDMIAGMHAFEAALLGLLQAKIGGRGQHLQVSLLDAIMAFQAPPIVESVLSGKLPPRTGTEHPLIAPSGMLETDDLPVVFTVLDHQWPRFCAAIGLEALPADPRFATNELRLRNRDALNAILRPLFQKSTSATLLQKLAKADVLAAPVNDYHRLRNDPQVVHNGTIEYHGRVPFLKNPITVEGGTAFSMPPRLGEHTQQILSDELGIDAARALELQALGVVSGVAAPESVEAG